MRAKSIEQRSHIVELGKVAEPKRAAADLVLVSGTNSAPRGADFAGAARVLAQRVEIAVDGKNQRAGVRNHQDLGRDGDALLAKPLDLRLQRPGIEDHAIADDGRSAGDDPRGDERELVGLALDDERVTGIVTALEAYHHVGAARQPVDDLSLAFVAPLGADDCDVSHVRSLL